MRVDRRLLTIALFLWAIPLAAQTRTVRGIVVDSADGNPIRFPEAEGLPRSPSPPGC